MEKANIFASFTAFFANLHRESYKPHPATARFQFVALFKSAQLGKKIPCHCEAAFAAVAISCNELRCAAGRGDSHGPVGLGMTQQG